MYISLLPPYICLPLTLLRVSPYFKLHKFTPAYLPLPHSMPPRLQTLLNPIESPVFDRSTCTGLKQGNRGNRATKAPLFRAIDRHALGKKQTGSRSHENEQQHEAQRLRKPLRNSPLNPPSSIDTHWVSNKNKVSSLRNEQT